MIELTGWTNHFLQALQDSFADRIWFVGLQGSYARGEATETSDLDMVVILDELSAQDIETYNTTLNRLPHRDLLCGFLAGKQELLNWEPSDLFQFYLDTTPILGSLDQLLTLIRSDDIDRAIRIGICNIYHGCVHNMLYEKSEDILKSLYKSASFVIQAIQYRKTGVYIRRQTELLTHVCPDDKIIVETFLNLKSGKPLQFQKMSQVLFDWAKNQINT